jgi:hypothetical protein
MKIDGQTLVNEIKMLPKQFNFTIFQQAWYFHFYDTTDNDHGTKDNMLLNN